LNSFMCLFMPSLTSLIILFFLSWQFWGLNSGPHLVDRLSSTWATPPALFFVLCIFQIRSLFVWAGLEPQSSWSLPPE
jgi:hypothetical protein